MRTEVTIKTDATTFGKQKLPNVYILRKICKGMMKEYNVTPEQLIKAVDTCPRCGNKQKVTKKPVRRDSVVSVMKVNCEICRGLGFIIKPERF